MEQPIINPPNPYVGPLRVFPTTLVKISGKPRPNATRFAINFQTGPSLNPRDDLALHLSPCFTPPRIVRNTLRNGAWGLEEAWGNGQIMSPHQPFEIMILAEESQFKIALNGAHYCEFRHRMPIHEISHLSIDGDVDIERISITSAYGQQQQQPAYHQPTAPPPHVPSMPQPPYGGGMPQPNMYPTLAGGPVPMPGAYPSAGGMPPLPTGPMPTGNTYTTGYPQGGGGGYPAGGPQQPYPQAAYPGAGGPLPQGAGYSSSGPMPHGYPPQQPHPQPGHSSGSTSTPFGNLPIGGKALGTLAGALKDQVSQKIAKKFPLARMFL